MYYIKNKMLQDSSGRLFKTIKDEFFLTADPIDRFIEYSKYVNAVRSNLVLQVVKLYILNEDETPLKDVSEYVLNGSVSYNYQQGQTHSLNLTLVNSDGFWVAEPINGNVWNGSKFRLDIGLYSGGNVFWRKCGIFVVQNVSIQGGASQQLSLQLYDKFAIYDGKISGKIDSDFKIPVGTNLKEAIELCVHYEDKDNGVKMFDTKPVIYEMDLSSITTPYTITKSPDATLGDIIIELANMASQDVFYNENGNLTLRPGNDALADDTRGVQWYYTQYDHLDYAEPTYTIDYGAIVNKMTVKGAIINGAQIKGTAINNNPLSKSNVILNRVNAEILEDSNIQTNELALERAKYELNKRLISYTKNSYKSIFIPHLMPKDVVMWTCPEFNIYNEKFIIQSLSFSLGGGFFMSIDMTNMKEVGVNGM